MQEPMEGLHYSTLAVSQLEELVLLIGKLVPDCLNTSI